MNDAGVPDFNALQNAIDTADAAPTSTTSSSTCPSSTAATCARCRCARAGRCCASCSTQAGGERVRLSQSFAATPAQMLEAACRMQLEGIILKRPDAPYVSARTETWLKLKCALRQEFVIGGFVDRSHSAAEVGSLLLGYLRRRRAAATPATSAPAGTRAPASDLHARLVRSSRSPTPPFDAGDDAAGPLVAPLGRRRALGQAAAGGRGVVSRVDARRPRAPRRVRGAARRQAGAVGRRAKRGRASRGVGRRGAARAGDRAASR